MLPCMGYNANTASEVLSQKYRNSLKIVKHNIPQSFLVCIAPVLCKKFPEIFFLRTFGSKTSRSSLKRKRIQVPGIVENIHSSGLSTVFRIPVFC